MRLRRALAAAGLATLGAALWWRRNPSACPYGQRFWVEAPHPLITRRRLRETLGPAAGERMLEIGPGTGYYTLEMAGWVLPGVTIEIFDLQQEMLDHTMDRARERGIDNVVPTQGDGWFDLETEDGVLSVDLDKVAFLRIDSGEHRVGFVSAG